MLGKVAAMQFEATSEPTGLRVPTGMPEPIRSRNHGETRARQAVQRPARRQVQGRGVPAGLARRRVAQRRAAHDAGRIRREGRAESCATDTSHAEQRSGGSRPEAERQLAAAAERHREVVASMRELGRPETGQHIAVKAVGRASHWFPLRSGTRRKAVFRSSGSSS